MYFTTRPRAVELYKEQRLPRAERELTVDDLKILAGGEEQSENVRMRVVAPVDRVGVVAVVRIRGRQSLEVRHHISLERRIYFINSDTPRRVR